MIPARHIAATLAAAACAVGLLAFLPAPYGGKVVAPLPDQPVTLDPALATRQSELQIISLLHDPLYRVDAAGTPRPNLVLPDPEISNEGLTWTLKLRPGLKLSNGAPLRLAHVVASLQRVTRGPNAHLLAPVRGIGAPGTGELVITLRAPTPHLPLLLSAPTTGVAVGQGKALLGTGPFRLTRASGGIIKLSPNLGHHAGRPYLDQLTLQTFARASNEAAAFQAGAIHVSMHGASLFGGAQRQVTASAASPACATLFLGVGKEPAYLADPQVRLALSTAVDRSRLARLAASDLLDTGAFAAYYTELSETLREYLGGRFGFDSMDLTTTELTQRLKRVRLEGLILEEVVVMLGDFDLVKFAKVEPAPEAAREALRQVERMVERTRAVDRVPSSEEGTS